MGRDADFHRLRPSIEEVAALLFSRLKHEGGRSVAVWDDTTEPTAAQADSLIDQATNQLIDRVGVPIKDSQVGRGKWLASNYAAAMIAREYIPEQTDDSAAYTGMMAEFTVQINSYVEDNRKPYALHLG
jgi:hypothetical protein